MAPRRPAFALIIALLGVSAVFPLALQAGLELRVATIETGAIIEADRQARQAENAARVFLAAIAGPAPAGETAPRRASSAADDASPDDILPGLPPEIAALLRSLEGLGDEMEETEPPPARDAADRPDTTRREWKVKGPLPAGGVRVTLAGETWALRAVDISGLLNVNTAEAEELERYALAVGLEPDDAARIADQIADWIDDDDFVRPRGAERDDYRRRGIAPRNGPMESIGELRYLPALTPTHFDRIAPGLTTRGGDRVNAMTAPEPVLRAIAGMTERSVSAIIRLREAGELDQAALRRVFTAAGDTVLRMTLAASNTLEVYARRVDPPGQTFAGTAAIERGGPLGPAMTPAPWPDLLPLPRRSGEDPAP